MSRWKVGLATFAVLACLPTAAQAQVFAGAGFNQGFGTGGFGQPFGGGFGNQGFGQAFGGGFGNQGFGQPFGGGFGNQGFGQPFGGGFGNQGFGQPFGGGFGNQGLGAGGFAGPGLGSAFSPQPQVANGLGVLSNTIRRQVINKRSGPVRRRR